MKKSEEGLLSLEASIAVTIFIFLMLYLYSFFVVFETRNEMAHVLLATADSLSLDPYENGKIGKSGNLAQLLSAIYHSTQSEGNGFISAEQWTEMKKTEVDSSTWDGSIYVPSSGEENLEPDKYGKKGAASSTLDQAIRERFVAYLAGGDEAEAEKILKRYHIVGGLNGLDFAGSCIKGKDLYVMIRYEIEYEFHVFGSDTIEFQQSVCSRIWK